MTLTVAFASHLGTAVLCALASALLVAGARVPRSLPAARAAVALALGAETLAAGLRWSVSGHPPVFGAFENTMASAWALALVVLLMLRRGDDDGVRWDATALLLWVPVTIAFGMYFERKPYPLTISERSILVDIHVVFAWAAYAYLLRGCMTAIRVLASGGDEGADDAMLRATGLGFVSFTGLMVVGAIYSFQLFTRFFSWELVETLSTASWLAYALVLHQRLFFGWRGRRLAWLIAATLPLLLATYWSWSIFTGTYHFFEIVELAAW